MHGDNEQTLKRRRTHSNLENNVEKSEVKSNGGTEQPGMADTLLEDCNNNIELTEGDVYTQLTNTEHDLALAKDIGEALLAENIELRASYESLLDEHASQVEVLQQENHELQLRRKRVESIQEEKIRELNVDLENLQDKLNVFEETSQDDKEARRESVYELIEENSKLHSDLTKVNTSNKELLAEVNKLQRMQRGKSLNESFDSETMNETEVLQQRLLILEDERGMLNASVNELMTEKNEVGKEVNLLTQKVITLTEELADSKSELSLCEDELNTCKKENMKLHEQLEEVKLQTSEHMALTGTSIFSEISLLENEADFSLKLAASPSCKRFRTVGSLHGTPKPLAASSSTNLLNRQHDLEPLRLNVSTDSSIDGDSSIEEVEGDGFVLKQQGYFAQFEEEQKVNIELRNEMCSVCQQLLQACSLLTNSEYQSRQTWATDIKELFSKDETGAGTLTMISAEMIGLLKEYLEKQYQSQMDTFSKDDQEFMEEKILSLESQVEDLTTECFEAKKQLSSLGLQLEQSRKANCENEEERTKLLDKIAALENEIENMKRNYSPNYRACRSKSVVDELEKSRRDVQKLDHQLLTAINQKIKLSEQLEQWQYDMAFVIEEQVQKQLNASNEKTKKKTSRLPFMKKGWKWTS